MSHVQHREPTDSDLIELIASGDRPAFEELYRRYARAVLGLALRRLGDRGRAEDAAQEAFLAIWRSARTYDPRKGSGACVALRGGPQCDHRRAPADARAGCRPPDEAAPEPGPPDRAEASWRAWQVHRALEILPEHERPVIELAYWRGLSQSEISDSLGIPLGTVKTRTRTALARLAHELDGTIE